MEFIERIEMTLKKYKCHFFKYLSNHVYQNSRKCCFHSHLMKNYLILYLKYIQIYTKYILQIKDERLEKRSGYFRTFFRTFIWRWNFAWKKYSEIPLDKIQTYSELSNNIWNSEQKRHLFTGEIFGNPNRFPKIFWKYCLDYPNKLSVGSLSNMIRNKEIPLRAVFNSKELITQKIITMTFDCNMYECMQFATAALYDPCIKNSNISLITLATNKDKQKYMNNK